MRFKKIVNSVLVLIIIASITAIIINQKEDNPTISSKEQLHTSNPEINFDNNPYNNNDIIKLSRDDYFKKVNESSELFSNILNKYHIETIATSKDTNEYFAHETSIMLTELGIPNGYKKIIVNPDANESINLYISLLNSMKNNTWGRTLNISLNSNTKFLEFNNVNFSETFELIETFNKSLDMETLKEDVNTVLFSELDFITKDNYSINKTINNGSNFIQISIHLEHGTITNEE